jgi:hypothetical protein
MITLPEKAEDLVKLLTEKLRETVDENDRLRAELARATEGANALATLQALYRDPALPESLRAKCAIGALAHESPRLNPISQLELKAERPPLPLAEVVRCQRARVKAIEGLPYDHPDVAKWVWNDNETMSEQVARLTGGTGDGQDDSSGD